MIASTAANGTAPLDPNKFSYKTYNILYNQPSHGLNPVIFRGSSLDDLRSFPVLARREAGFQIDQVQRGGDPDDWKPM